jgi:hypothetical protein
LLIISVGGCPKGLGLLDPALLFCGLTTDACRPSQLLGAFGTQIGPRETRPEYKLQRESNCLAFYPLPLTQAGNVRASSLSGTTAWYSYVRKTPNFAMVNFVKR